MILELESFEYLVVFNKRYSLHELFQKTNAVPGSYAEELTERIYNCLFKYSRDIKQEYNQYYAIEYSDLAEFLYWKYEIDRPIARQIASRVNEGAFVGYTGESIGMLLADDAVSPIIEDMFSELGETINENPNRFCDE